MHPPVAPRRSRLRPDVEQQDAALRAQDLSPAESAVLPPSWLGAPLAQTTAGPLPAGQSMLLHWRCLRCLNGIRFANGQLDGAGPLFDKRIRKRQPTSKLPKKSPAMGAKITVCSNSVRGKRLICLCGDVAERLKAAVC